MASLEVMSTPKEAADENPAHGPRVVGVQSTRLRRLQTYDRMCRT